MHQPLHCGIPQGSYLELGREESYLYSMTRDRWTKDIEAMAFQPLIVE